MMHAFGLNGICSPDTNSIWHKVWHGEPMSKHLFHTGNQLQTVMRGLVLG